MLLGLPQTEREIEAATGIPRQESLATIGARPAADLHCDVLAVAAADLQSFGAQLDVGAVAQRAIAVDRLSLIEPTSCPR